jgi:hypothetical protein
MSKIYYKVTNSQLQSVWVQQENLKTQYVLGEFVKPQILEFPLSVFKTKSAAQTFIRWLPCSHRYNVRLFECEIKRPTKTPWLIGKTKYVNDIWLDNKYQNRIIVLLKLIRSKQKFLNHTVTDLPLGTVTCREVKLTKEITN